MKTIVPVQLNKNCSDPMYVQLYKKLKDMVEKGRLKNNEKLPPIRKISEQLGVNNSTVISAYKLLESTGYAYSRIGSGTYVCSRESSSGSDINFRTGPSLYKGKYKINISAPVDFSNSSPDPALFPVDYFKQQMDEVLERDGGNAFNYTELKGYLPLRESISGFIKCSDIYADPEDIYIVSGAQQGIDVISKVLIDYGDVIVTENPTYTGATAVFKSRGAKITGIPINEQGILINELESKLGEVKPKFVYVMPNFQNPTGFSYSQPTKEKLLYLAQKYDFYIIEDDYLSEIYYTSQKPVTLKSMDRYDRVIYIKSFSKIFMPGARLGFIIVPEKLRSRVLAAKHFSDISSSGFMQRVFDLFIRNTLFENYIESVRMVYKDRYTAITDIIDGNLDMVSYFKPEGGIHLWIKLNGRVSSNMIYSECLANNIIISPGSLFFIDSLDSQYFRISYASLDNEGISKGIGILKNVIHNVQDNSPYLGIL